MKKTLHFKSDADYKKWLAYGHMHGVFKAVPGSQRVVIGGRAHRVRHSRK